MTQVAVTFLNYLERRPPLATDDPPNQTEQHVTRRQCAGATGQRASPSHNRWGSTKAMRGGGRLLLHLLPSAWSFVFKIARQKLVKHKRPSKLVLPYPLQASGSTPLKNITHQQKTLKNKSENSRWSTRNVVAADVDRIKGRPIYPLEGSCSGYPLIPYLAASDACSQHCFNLAAKKQQFI